MPITRKCERCNGNGSIFDPKLHARDDCPDCMGTGFIVEDTIKKRRYRPRGKGRGRVPKPTGESR